MNINFIRYYYFTIEKKGREFIPKLTHQKIEFFEKKIFKIYKLSEKQDVIIKDSQKDIPNFSSICLSCQEAESAVIISPCMHVCICLRCSENFKKLDKLKDKKCPSCGVAVEAFYDIKGESTGNKNNKRCRVF